MNSSSGNNEQKELSEKYRKLVMEVGEIWKLFKGFAQLIQPRFMDRLSVLQTKCFEKDAACLDHLKTVAIFLQKLI